jgi:hypothetical protein
MAQGSGKALDFNPNAAGNNHVTISNSLPIGTSDFSIEFWMFVSTVNGDPAIVSNKDWASGNNTGFNIAIQGGGSDLDINFKGATGTRKDLNITSVNFVGFWHHVAVSFTRAGNMTVFVDGVQRGTLDISGSTGTILGTLPVNIGEDGTGDYTYTGTHYDFEGIIDEFRMWDFALTQGDVRDYMCQKLTGTEPGLLVYYPFEDASGTTVTDVSGNVNGTLMNPAASNANRVTSGASLGDVATATYPGSWTGQTIALSSPSNGTFTLDNITGNADGIHVYRVDDMPNNYSGIGQPAGNDTYFGVFVAGGSSVGYQVNYDYTGFAAAENDEANIFLYRRIANDSPMWSDVLASVNTGSNVMSVAATLTRAEFIVGNFISAPCNDPSALTATNISTTSADLSWTSGGSGQWNLEYGPQGFTLGTGTQNALSSSTYALSGLSPSMSYDYYVQDDCGATQSNWVGPYTFSTISIPSNQFLGSAAALDFDGSDDWVNLSGSTNKVSATSLGLPTGAITVEAWVYPRTFETWHAMVGFLQDNGSTESGWDLELRDGGKFGFTLASGSGGLTYMETNNSYPANQWYHIAGTYDGDSMKLYVNGVMDGASTAETGSIFYLDSWLTIGQYKDDNESYTVDAMVDEVRIWNTQRTQFQIRDMMCEKLIGNESGLVGYYRLDENGGTAVNDLSPSGNHGALTNMTAADWVVSAAPIGDDSEHSYTGTWNGATVNLSSADNGNMQVANVDGEPHGMHVFRVDGNVDQMSGVNYPAGSDTYYGVFPAIDFSAVTGVSYTASWDYSSFTDAVANESDLLLFNRATKLSAIWANAPATLNTAGDMIMSDTVAGRKEWLLALNTGFTCNIPSDLEVLGAGLDSAVVGWTTGGATDWNIQYGDAGFQLGDGTIDLNTGTTSYELNGLAAQAQYEVYVQDTCIGTGASLWFGPILVSTSSCDEPSALSAVNVTHNTADLSWNGGGATGWNLVWGNAGFPVQFGIPVNNLTQPMHTLTGLAANTTYEYYVRGNCGGTLTNWVGPFAFTTTVNQTGVEEHNGLTMQVFPNPAGDVVQVFWDNRADEGSSVSIMDLAGRIVYSVFVPAGTSLAQLDLSGLSGGTYAIRVESGMRSSTVRFVRL